MKNPSSARVAAWPELELVNWEGTRDTLQLWTQVVGKARLALEPKINHRWQLPLYVSARGLTTSLMHAGGVGVEIEFDFINHSLDIQTTDGQVRPINLQPRSVASFYAMTPWICAHDRSSGDRAVSDRLASQRLRQ